MRRRERGGHKGRLGSGPKPQPQAEEGEHRRQNGHIVQNKWRRNAYERAAQGYRMKYKAICLNNHMVLPPITRARRPGRRAWCPRRKLSPRTVG